MTYNVFDGTLNLAQSINPSSVRKTRETWKPNDDAIVSGEEQHLRRWHLRRPRQTEWEYVCETARRLTSDSCEVRLIASRFADIRDPRGGSTATARVID